MKLSIISTSQQKNSQSKRVSKIFKNLILNIDDKIECFNLDMFENKIPLWTSEKSEDLTFWRFEDLNTRRILKIEPRY